MCHSEVRRTKINAQSVLDKHIALPFEVILL